jgi:hypothetical protein
MCLIAGLHDLVLLNSLVVIMTASFVNSLEFRAFDCLNNASGLQRDYAVVVRHINSNVESVEKVFFLTNVRSISFNYATLLGYCDFSYSLVRQSKQEEANE